MNNNPYLILSASIITALDNLQTLKSQTHTSNQWDPATLASLTKALEGAATEIAAHDRKIHPRGPSKTPSTTSPTNTLTQGPPSK